MRVHLGWSTYRNSAVMVNAHEKCEMNHEPASCICARNVIVAAQTGRYPPKVLPKALRSKRGLHKPNEAVAVAQSLASVCPHLGRPTEPGLDWQRGRDILVTFLTHLRILPTETTRRSAYQQRSHCHGGATPMRMPFIHNSGTLG